MPMLLEIMTGESKGAFFRVEAGQTIGRSRADIILNDPNISGTHAKFDLDNKGQLILVDLESANGLLLNKRRVKKVALLPGVKFQIGRCLILAKETTDEEADRLAPILGWQAQLKNYLTKSPIVDNDSTPKLTAFDPILELEFLRGTQAGESLVIGYGPRLVGSNTWDVELNDLKIPDLAFELVSEKGRPRLNNLCGQSLTLNGHVVNSQALQADDIIVVGESAMKVNLK